jgi:hypothetical protein
MNKLILINIVTRVQAGKQRNFISILDADKLFSLLQDVKTDFEALPGICPMTIVGQILRG